MLLGKGGGGEGATQDSEGRGEQTTCKQRGREREFYPRDSISGTDCLESSGHAVKFCEFCEKHHFAFNLHMHTHNLDPHTSCVGPSGGGTQGACSCTCSSCLSPPAGTRAVAVQRYRPHCACHPRCRG